MKGVLVFVLIMMMMAAGETVKDSGIAVHIKQDLFDNLKNTVIKQFIDSIETGDFADIQIVKDLKLFKVMLDLKNMKLKEFKLDLDDSFLSLRDNAPYLELFISNFSLNFTFDFNLRSDPAFVEDKGDGRFEFKPTSLYIGYDITIVNGKPQFKTISAKMNCTDLNIYANGTADFSKVITQLGSYLKDTVKSRINDYLVSIVDSTVTPIINDVISNAYSDSFEVLPNVIVNFTSTKNPAFSSSHMTMFFKGETHPKGESILPFASKLEVPSEINSEGRQLQIAISDYFFNSTIYSLYKGGYLKLDTMNINGTQMAVPVSYFYLIFPSLAKKYEPDVPVWFRAKATEDKYLPYMEIVNGTTIAYFDFDIEMAATKNPETLLKIKTTVQAEINVYIVKGFKVTVDIQKFKFKLNEITENNIDPTLDPRDISSFIGFISGFLRNYINQFIRNFEVKLPISDKINLKDIELKPKEHFIYADVTPYISIK